ncbi:MAG: HU family DNA-binding protein [Thermoplasmata archaeon]
MVGISDLSKRVSRKVNVTQRDAKEIIESFLEEIIGAVNNNEKVSLVGFGIFERKKQKERKALNPQTKQVIKVPSKSKFVFRASSKIKYK